MSSAAWFRDIDAECYVMTDGDDTYPAEDARKLADQILQGKADMVIGDRLSSTYFTENKRPFHNMGNSSGAWAYQPDFQEQYQGYHDRRARI